MCDNKAFLEGKCPVCEKGRLGIRMIINDDFPDLYCTNTTCNKLFRAYKKDSKNNIYRIHLIDKNGNLDIPYYEVKI